MVLFGSAQARRPLTDKQAADFRVLRLDHGGWEICVLSAAARSWTVQVAGLETADTGTPIRTNLAGVNDFINRARKSGYRTEYVGPREVIYL